MSRTMIMDFGHLGPYGECDWGGCENQARYWRNDPDTGERLMACSSCALRADAQSLADDPDYMEREP